MHIFLPIFMAYAAVTMREENRMLVKNTLALTLVTALSVPAFANEAAKNPLAPGETWEYLREDVVGDTPITESEAVLSLDAPYRAHDAATVPILLKQQDEGTTITSATVVVDENPAPVAGKFTFSDAMAPLDFELRVRVDQYSNVRVITETPEGLYMTGRFVKASGGCSAPASGDMELALASMGQMKLRSFEPALKMSGQRRQAQIMIRHPNYSGLQRDQITQLFIPAHFLAHSFANRFPKLNCLHALVFNRIAKIRILQNKSLLIQFRK
jgi:sulfur-oxidizing protein SoxY